MAASAAAMLLSSGTYSIAYPGAFIHFHGVRNSRKEHLTMEDASNYARQLRDTNDRRALDLAHEIIADAVWIYLCLKDKAFDEVRRTQNDPDITDVECFATSIAERVGDNVALLCKKAYNKYVASIELSDYVFRENLTSSKSLGDFERRVLKRVVDYDYRLNRNSPDWHYDEDNLSNLFEEFRLIKDFSTGAHRGSILDLGINYWRCFATGEEITRFDTGEIKEDEFNQWVSATIVPRLQPIWYFVVSICRLLQEKENPLTPEDAYWLGLVNEVLGSDELSMRSAFENIPDATAAEPEIQDN